MHCPECGSHLQREAQEAGSAYVCGRCGWGRDPESARIRSELGRNASAPRIALSTWLKLPFFWAVALLICLGPYLAIVHGLPWLAAERGWAGFSRTPAELHDKITPGYWMALLAYLLVAEVSEIGVDFENLGLFGGLMDNPFTHEDDFNRWTLLIGLALIPGKFATFTLMTTLRLLRRLVSTG